MANQRSPGLPTDIVPRHGGDGELRSAEGAGPERSREGVDG